MAEKMTIFVVEDEPSLRALVRKVLERHGFDVVDAASGVAALAMWEQNKAAVNVLLTDMVMPDGMTGRELADRLQTDNPNLKVVYTTGYSAELLGKDIVLKEGYNFLQKPYPPSKLIETIRNALAPG